MGNKTSYHLNDKTMKYKTMTQTKRQHEYLKLPGKFKTRYPQEVVFPNMDSGRMDELYLTNLNILVNLEEELVKLQKKHYRNLQNMLSLLVTYIIRKCILL